MEIKKIIFYIEFNLSVNCVCLSNRIYAR